MTFAARLEGLLLEYGLQAPELAQLIGARPATVYGWLNGKTEPNLEYLNKLARVFRCTTNKLLRGVEYRNEDHRPGRKLGEWSGAR